ncbi:MAG: RES family NAD+ phosphorylase, partial [Planctomycetota bacterium]
SRFGTRSERSLWYGSSRPRTTFAETAYYRLVFLEGTAAELGPVAVELSLFHAPLRTSRGVDLSRAPFERQRAVIASPSRYGATQELGREMREDGVHAFRYPLALCGDARTGRADEEGRLRKAVPGLSPGGLPGARPTALPRALAR